MICIGYSTIEEWCKVIDNNSPIYTCLVQEDSPSNVSGLVYKKDIVFCSKVDSDKNVHYFRQTLRTYTSMDKKENTALEGWHLIKEWLNLLFSLEEGFTIREGAIAMPQDLKLLEGYADFLRWDKEKNQYYREKTKN